MEVQAGKITWLEEIIESIHDGILVIDINGIVRLINKEYTSITGVTEEQIIGRPLLDVRPGAQLPSVLSSGKPLSGIFRREGKEEYVVDMAPIYDKNGIIGAVSVCKSATEVIVLSSELKKSKKRVSQLEKAFVGIHKAKYRFQDIIGNNASLKDVIQQAKKVAPSDLNILLTGESGTGKELFAQAIHQSSKRNHYPFVPVNCAAIPSALLESELFGYEEGAFTNSKQDGKIGLFELANNGTLFLDEIGDMPFDLQAKLLRVLQEGTFRKIGGLTEQKIDVRIIAATNKDLSNMAQKERFREDLYYRINTVHIPIPPLRNRKDDIPQIVDSLLEKHHPTMEYQFDQQAMELLQNYDWPGNIRELRNAVHYAVNMTDHNEVTIDALPETIKKLSITSKPPLTRSSSLAERLNETEKRIIAETLQQTGMSVKGKKEAAKLLGISLASLYNKMTKLKMD